MWTVLLCVGMDAFAGTPTVDAGAGREAPVLPARPVSLGLGTWGYRQGVGLRLEVWRHLSFTTALDPLHEGSLASHSGLEVHPGAWSVGRHGWIEPTLGLGGYATDGFAPVYANPTRSAGLYAAPGARWTGPRGRTSTLLGVTGRLPVQGEQTLDPIALTWGVEIALAKRDRSRVLPAGPLDP